MSFQALRKFNPSGCCSIIPRNPKPSRSLARSKGPTSMARNPRRARVEPPSPWPPGLLRVPVHYRHVVSAGHQPVADPTPHIPGADDGDVHTHPPRCPYLTLNYRTRAGHGLLGQLCTMRRADFRENAHSRSHLMNVWW
jgi:hypothetical protein